MERLTYDEIETLQHTLLEVENIYGLKVQQLAVLSKLERMRHEAGADLVRAKDEARSRDGIAGRTFVQADS